ncbi:MAG: EAL domain-containing protein, partial [Angustibacter sp.]
TLFDVQLKAQVETRMHVEQRLRSALEEDRLVAVYQPIVSMTDDRMIAVEALARMREQDGSLSHPDSFIAVAEESGLIVELDQWMLEQSVQALGEWQKRNVGTLGVQVNVSAQTLARPGFEDFVMNLLARHRVEPTDLRFELTEVALVPGGSLAQDAMLRLAGLGVRSGIDDFGTGYSSLAYLHALPVSFLKVDRMFVSRLDGSHRANAVVRAVIELAHAHGYSVTAEGVETAKQAEILREMGCDDAQGWLFGRPQLWQPPSAAELVADLNHPTGVGVHHW